MTPYGTHRYQPNGERHFALIFIAMLLSCVAHFCVMYFCGDYALGIPTGLSDQIRKTLMGPDRAPPMRVEMMPVDPLRMLPRVKGERERPSHGAVDVSSRVETLRQQTPPALTAPPPVPREALTPGVPALKEAVADKVDTTPWVPRQEITQIYDRTVQDELATLPRREIPLIERVANAPDMVPSIDLAGRRFGKDPEPPKAFESAEIFDQQLAVGSVKVPLPKPPVHENESIPAEATVQKFALPQKARSGKIIGTEDSAENATVASATQKILDQAGKAGQNGTGNPASGSVASGNGSGGVLSPAEKQARAAQEQIEQMHEKIDYLPIDDLLQVHLDLYEDPSDASQRYFQVSIQPNPQKPVPTIPKDIVFVQDVSGSMQRERMVFCRRALAEALKTLNTGDRFNIVAFRESFEYCFQNQWAEVNPDHLRKAAQFIDGMQARGNTDLFRSLKALLELPRDPKRPMVAFVVTDGVPTAGLVKNAEIISDFSLINEGMMSVYMFGISSQANAYLLDMLTYCNRGNFSVMPRGIGRWSIPEQMGSAYESIRNPLMADISVVFDSASQAEVYPQRTPNLYRDRPLILNGVCPAGTKEIVFQIRGLASAKGYDSVFRLRLDSQAQKGTAALKRRWADQKMYHLAGAYARRPSAGLMQQMRGIHALYQVEIPYENKLK